MISVNHHTGIESSCVPQGDPTSTGLMWSLLTTQKGVRLKMLKGVHSQSKAFLSATVVLLSSRDDCRV